MPDCCCMGAQLEPPSPAVSVSLSRSAPLICKGQHWASRTACQQHCWRQQPLYEKLNWGRVERIRAAPLERACALPCASPAWSCLAAPDGRRIAAETAATGLEALPHMAEIYPLGGEPACLAAPVHPCRKSDPVCLPALEFSHATQLAGRACLQQWATLLPACSSASVQLLQLYGNLNSTLLSGAGDRLGLTCSVTGEGLPVAELPYCGRPLLESLIRDLQVSLPGCFVCDNAMLAGLLLLPWQLQHAAVAAEALLLSSMAPHCHRAWPDSMLLAAGMAHCKPHGAVPPQLDPPFLQAREYLFFRLYGVQQVTPIVIMTSDAKGNHERVTEFMESCDWYGRGRKSFRSAPAGTLPCDAAFLCQQHNCRAVFST